jgi:hypothetical protein
MRIAYRESAIRHESMLTLTPILLQPALSNSLFAPFDCRRFAGRRGQARCAIGPPMLGLLAPAARLIQVPVPAATGACG